MLDIIPFVTGKAAVFGITGLAVAFYATRRPTVAIAGAVLAAGVSTLF